MLVDVSFLCKHDKIPSEDFEHVTSWVNPTPGTRSEVRGDKKYAYDRIEEDLQVDTEGLRSPVRGELLVTPPAYPPLRAERRPCDSSVLLDVENHAAYLVLAVDDIGEGVPAMADGLGSDDPIPEARWSMLKTGIVAVTPEDNKEQVGNLMDNWRENNPNGTPAQWLLKLRNFTR